MCLIVLAYQAHPDFKLVLAANRDEYFDRPAVAAGYWKDSPETLAGRDLLQGGTWLGINRNLSFAAVANYRDSDSSMASPLSRGLLVKDFLTGALGALEYTNALTATSGDYAGYNFLAGDADQACFFSNRVNEVKVLTPGVYGISNGDFDAPWPKVVKAKKSLVKELNAAGHLSIAAVFSLLHDESVPAAKDLPDTGIGFERERQLAPVFVTLDEYGTRSSTIITIDKDNAVGFYERTHDKARRHTSDVNYHFIGN